MPYKDESLTFTINGRRKSPVQTNIQYTTQDKGTAKLSFQLMKDGVPLPLSAAVVKLVLLMSDGSRFVRNVEITDKLNGRLTYVLSDEEIKHVGTVQAELDVSYTNQQAMSIHQFSFEIKKALIDADILPSTEYYIDDFESLKNKINELYNETVQTVEELRKKFENLENIETKDGAQKKADAVQSNLDVHIKNKSNPHGVTKNQVGLGNVDNVQQASKEDFELHVSDAVQHISMAERSKWNGSQIHKITQDDGRVFYKSATEVTDYNDLTDTGMYLIYNKGLNGPELFYCFLHVMSSKNTLVQIAYDGYKGEQAFFRMRKNDSITWTAWVELESTVGAQKKVDAHANRRDNPHNVTKAQVGLDKVENVQQATKQEFDGHNYNSVRHITQIERDKWNGGQLAKLTKDDGKRTQLANGADILALSSGFYYASGSLVKNNPVENDGSWFNYDVIEGDTGRKSIIAWRSYDNVMWHGTVHTNGVFKGWKRLITDADFENVLWQNIPLKNGAANGDRPFQYAVWGKLLLLRGHITAPREVIIGNVPKSVVPSNGDVVAVTTSGITGYCKLVVYPNGELMLTGLQSNDNSAVTGYHISAPVFLD
ncbi:BppU family phage baseplate upper protein [Bacillus subtilis]|uniref:BppU family phage baseplate upper protein n=1 Tax=Bacillus subtilis TaxID=1423 RepID=UPI001E416B56|nr:BppU family phage baseplate upper protein [Bacillus subtilis]MCX4077490.1 BppU family phage baseplate upper protein [Bacillus subtilis]